MNSFTRDNLDTRIKNNNNPEAFLAASTSQQFAQRRIRILKKHFPTRQVTSYAESLHTITSSLQKFNENRIQTLNIGSKLQTWNMPPKQQSNNVVIPQQKLLNQARAVIQTTNQNIHKLLDLKKSLQKKPEQTTQYTNVLSQSNNEQKSISSFFAPKIQTKPVGLFHSNQTGNSLFSNILNKPLEKQKPLSNNGLFSSAIPISKGSGLFDNQQLKKETVPQKKVFNDSSFLFKKQNKPETNVVNNQYFDTSAQPSTSLFSTHQKKEQVHLKNIVPQNNISTHNLFRDKEDNQKAKTSNQLLFNNNQSIQNQPKFQFTLKTSQTINNNSTEITDLLKNSKYSAPTGLFNNAITTQLKHQDNVKPEIDTQQQIQPQPQPLKLFGTIPQSNINIFLNNNLFSKPLQEIKQQKPQKIIQQPSLFNNINNSALVDLVKIKQPSTNQIPMPKLQTNSEVIKQKSLFGTSQLFHQPQKQTISSNFSLFSTPAINTQGLFSKPSASLFNTQTSNNIFDKSLNNTSKPTTSLFGGANNLFGDNSSLGGNMFSQGGNIFNKQTAPKTNEGNQSDEGQDSGPIQDDQPQVQNVETTYQYKSELKVILKYPAQLFKRNQQQSHKHVIVSLQQSINGEKLYLFVRSKQNKLTIYTGTVVAQTIYTMLQNKTSAKFVPVLSSNNLNPPTASLDTIRIKFMEESHSQLFGKAMKTHQG